MSTQQILGVVGGVVGAFFGYPQLGFVVGSLVGGLLTPGEKTEGPRVDDLKVQVSTYGAGIPILYGTERVGGNVAWSTDKIEMEETTGGKGGAPEQTTYRYFVHMGIVLCETPRDGSTVSIVQIFQDGKLIYDARSGIPVGSALASAENPHAYFVLYQGHADQLPDPGEEAWMGGPGSVPAYRGVVRIRMNAVECPGGRVPQFSFVISTRSVSENVIYEGAEIAIPAGNRLSASRIFSDGASSTIFAEYSVSSPEFSIPIKRVDVHSLSFEGATQTNSFVIPSSHSFRAIPGDADLDAICIRDVDANSGSDTGVNRFYGVEGGLLSELHLGSTCIAFGVSDSSWSKRGNKILISGDSNHASFEVCLGSWDAKQVIARTTIGPSPKAEKVIATDNYGWVLLTGAPPVLQVRSLDENFGTILASAEFPGEATGFEFRVTGMEGDALAAWAGNPLGTQVYVYDISFDGAAINFSLRNTASKIDASIPHAIEQTIGVRPDAVYGWQASLGSEWSLSSFMVSFNRIAILDARVSEIISDQCARAGEDRIDLSGIPDSDTVHGYKLQNPASARANIDPLLTAYAGYMVDEDGVIKFKKYEDITSVASISYGELGQAEAGAESADAMPLNRAQEVDLPRSVSVSYLEPLRDYQTASEKESRQITEANEDLIVELPLASTSDHAKRVAQTILFDRWRAQNTRSCKVSRKYAFASPGDGITVEYPRGTWRLWRITSMTDTGALCEFNVEPGDADLYAKTAIGATGYVGQQVSPLSPPTRMVIGDWPLLRDADNNPGIYVAFHPLGSGWRGATLYVGDDDSSLEERGTTFTSCAIGVADAALGPWDLNIIDQVNTLTVSAPADAFSGITYDVLVSSQTVNALAVGRPGRWEILQFATANYLGGNLWLLYDFKRGQRGTEFATGLHAFGDTVVLLNPNGMLRPNMDAGALYTAKQYRAVSVGRSLSSVTSQAYSNTGEGLRPFSPVQLSHALVGSDIVFTWSRRTRLSNNWLAGIVPLGESSEAYVLTLYTDGTFATAKRIFAATEPVPDF